MRTVTIGALALLAGGCASMPMYDLVPRGVEPPWLQGQHWVQSESEHATLMAAFDRTWADWLVFDVEVVNRSDSTLRIDPGEFSFTLSSSRGDLRAAIREPVHAVDPGSLMGTVDRWIPRVARDPAAVEMVEPFRGSPALAESAQDRDDPPALETTPPEEQGPLNYEQRMAELWMLRDRWASTVLVLTYLPPGHAVSGTVWLPAWPLRQALGPTRYENTLSITAQPSRLAGDHALTLWAPPALGAQRIDYDVSVE